MLSVFGKLLNSNDREIKSVQPLVDRINSLEETTKKLKDKEFSKRTAEFILRLERGETLNNLLPEAYSLAREAAFRSNNTRPFNVQVAAAIFLHQGKITELKTGEGKTLTAVLPLYLNALTKRGVHLVTVNDYLAKVGVGWMGPIFHYLGMTCSAIVHDASFIYDPDFTDESASDSRLRHLRPISRKEAYAADVTYGINSEFGFDYLRDNMARTLSEVSQREFHFAIVDEVDSVLIDEARTPHIISAPEGEPTSRYYDYAKMVDKLTPLTDYIIDEKLRTAHLTDAGVAKIETLLGVQDIYEKDFATVHHIEAALKARTLFIKEKDYIVRDNQVVIVDEFTGRLMAGRRWSEGIHQAVEAKEGVPIQQESKTLATISLQNYFRKYEKLAGMTGTAATESEEFHKIYGLEVVVIPTNNPMVRIDNPDAVYKNQRAKYNAVVNEIAEAHKRGQPVLVGTTSIDKNEIIAQLLRQKGVPHQVLNAKQHEKEALIISEAGKKGAVTVATNMAGRGVDIILGGNAPTHEDGRPKLNTPEWKKWQKDHDEVISLGGLHVIGTERHESRRIDNQLRGRGGRQGDPGSTRFFVALDDDIMRLFGGDQVSKLMTFFNIPEDQPLEHSIVSKAIESAQSKVEQFHFDSRKHLLEYDDVMNKQREIIYARRRTVLEHELGLATKANDIKKKTEATPLGEELKAEILEKIEREISLLVTANTLQSEDEKSVASLVDELATIIPFDENSKKGLVGEIEKRATVEDRSLFLQGLVKEIYSQRESQIGPQMARYIEQQETLRVMDSMWMEHLESIDDLREGIGLRGYAQRNPLVEYKSEAFTMFEKLLAAIDYEIVHRIFKIGVVSNEQAEKMRQQMITNAAQIENIAPIKDITNDKKQITTNAMDNTVVQKPIVSGKIPGRNDLCPCGSGQKYKKCGLINSADHQKNLAKK